MIKEKQIKEVSDFLSLHIKTQIETMIISKELNKNGYPGFAWFYQIQSSDEFLHQRRIINFLQSSLGAENYSINLEKVEPIEIKDPREAIKFYIDMRQKTLDIALENKHSATEAKDYLTADFYNWFIKDYWTEIDENNDILDRINMNWPSIATLDEEMGKREEIDPNHVIHPMQIFSAD